MKIATVVIHTEYDSGPHLHRVEKMALAVARQQLAERIRRIRLDMRKTGDYWLERIGKMSYSFHCGGWEYGVGWDGTHEVRS